MIKPELELLDFTTKYFLLYKNKICEFQVTCINITILPNTQRGEPRIITKISYDGWIDGILEHKIEPTRVFKTREELLKSL